MIYELVYSDNYVLIRNADTAFSDDATSKIPNMLMLDYLTTLVHIAFSFALTQGNSSFDSH